VNLLQRLTTQRQARSVFPGLSLYDYLTQVGESPFGLIQSAAGWSTEEQIQPDFVALAQAAMKRSGVVWACLATRAHVFAEARLAFQQMRGGRPDRLFSTPELSIFEEPRPRWTTRDLLMRMMLDADLAGTGLVTRRPGRRLVRLRPDWSTFVLASRDGPVDDPNDIDADLFGLLYQPPGGREEVILPEDLAVFAPTPDPVAWWRGASWLTTILRELQADESATEHRLAFFRNGATPNLVISFDKEMKMEQVKRFKALLEAEHRSAVNAYKTLYLAGATATTVGSDFKSMDLRNISGLSETRIAAAAGVHPVILGLSEGMQGSSLNAGNYGQVRRRFADITMAPLWAAAASALQPLVTVPSGARLWYDVRDVPALREDRADVAKIQVSQATAIGTLVREGFEPESVIAAVEAEDMTLLRHTGLVSVQLHPATGEPVPTGDDGGGSEEGS
jgi:hypothetical protein